MALESEASGITAEESRTSVLYRGCALSGPLTFRRSSGVPSWRRKEKQRSKQLCRLRMTTLHVATGLYGYMHLQY